MVTAPGPGPGGDAPAWWCEYAWVPPGRVAAGVLVETADGIVTRVREAAPCPPGAARLAGLVLPGLANAHSHAFHRVLRARSQKGRGSFWAWRDLMYAVADRLTPDSSRELATAVYAEMVLAGVTRVGEFHYVHHAPGGRPYAEPGAMGVALADAAGAAGVRLTLLDTCYLAAGPGRPPEGTQLRFADAGPHAWAERAAALAGALAGRPGLLVGAAVHSVRAVPAEALATVAAWAAERGVPLHAHLSEQPAENEACLAAYGRTPAALLADHGVLGPAATAVHATHVSEADVALLAASGTRVCLCPTTERDLADGIGPAGALAAAGVRLSLGSDSHAVVDLLEEARAVETGERVRSGVRGTFAAPALLALAAANGHAALGFPRDGVIAPGAAADLVAVRLDSLRTAGCGASAATAVFAASAADVTDVVVTGRQVVRAGRHVAIADPGAVLGRAVRALTG